ncbi:CDP-alcohol phosphatidyltransferase family protein [Amycolatopsis nigrescens]|uniref:CDP-alcohol phosphatidyltransferase family protein n=1 Tax=Amycolatopsis nigrescens TaxID=381445 RepID=UPI00035CC6BE|nr:CDP-alcohol phosphatidyltransferase family protein [Amycolatopsis nigrescens]
MTEGPADTGFTAALRRLPSAQKSARGAPAYSRFVNRPAGKYLAATAYRLGMTPNQVTAVSALFTFSGIAIIALVRPSPLLGIVVGAALALGYALDSADGQLARLTGGGSTSGEWLDHIVDSAKIASLHLAVLISYYRFSDLDRAYLLVPVGFQVVAVITFFGLILGDQLRRQHRVDRSLPAGTRASTLRSLAVLPIDYGLLCLVFLLLGVQPLFSICYAVLFAANIGYLALALVKWFREMAALDSAPEKTATENS